MTPPPVHAAISDALPTGTLRNGSPAAEEPKKKGGDDKVVDADFEVK